MYGNHANQLRKKNLSPLPCIGKGTFIKGWSKFSDELPSVRYIDNLVSQHPDKNTTIVLGRASGIIALDIDFEDKEHIDKILKIVPPSPIQKKGKKGLTAFYKYSGEETLRLRTGKTVVLEILSDGANTVIPPSIHPDTKLPYIYLSDMTLETIDREKLTVLPDICIRKMEEYVQSLSLQENTIKKDSVSIDASRTMKLKELVSAKLYKGIGIAEIVKDIILYDKQKHTIPLFEDKTEGVCKADSFTNALQFVANITMSINKGQIKKGEDVVVPHEHLESTDELGKIELVKLSDLLAEPVEDCSFLIEGLLPMGGSSLLFAKPKAGKSTLARNMVMSIATGKEFLGRAVEKSKVVYLALEEKRGEVQKHFKEMGATGEEDIYIHTGFIDSSCIKILKECIVSQEPGLVIIDTLNAFIRVSDGNDYTKFLNALLPYISLARDYNTHLMFIHHARKDDSLPFDSILGSTAILASIDTAIYIKRGDEATYIQSRQRYGTDLENHSLKFTESSRTFELGEMKTSASAAKIKNQILECLKESEERVNQHAVIDYVEGKTVVIKKGLSDLCKKGVVNKYGKGRKGSPYLYTLSNKELPAF